MGILFDLKGQVNLADIFNLNSTCCIVSIAVNSLVHHFVIQPNPVTTLIHDPGFPIVHKKLSKAFVPGLVYRLLTKACLQATNQGLSTGYQPRLLCRLPNKAYPQATNQGLFIGYQPRLVHRLLTKACPQATNQGLSAGYQLGLVHRLPTKVCPQATDQDLSTGYQPRLVHRLSTKACPQATNQGWSTGYQPRLVHRLPTKACSQAANWSLFTHYVPQATNQGLSTFPTVHEYLFTGHKLRIIDRPCTDHGSQESVIMQCLTATYQSWHCTKSCLHMMHVSIHNLSVELKVTNECIKSHKYNVYWLSNVIIVYYSVTVHVH